MSTWDDGKSKAKHESIEALLAAHPGESDPEKLMRKLARSKVAYAKRVGWTGPPFCPKQFTSIFGIQSKEVDHDIGGGDGRILLCPDGKPRIEYHSKRLPERQRFTIFHEFAHTLFPDYCEFLPLHKSAQTNEPDPDKEVELLCDIGAAEMLMPLEDFRRDVDKQKRIGIEAIHVLRKLYQASIDATTHRLIDLEENIACAAVFLTDQKGRFSGIGPLWVKYFRRSSGFRCFISPGTSPPASSVAFDCYQSGEKASERVRETWSIKGQPRTWLVQAARLPVISENPNYPKVVALLLPPN
jgi:IrrE N-terminal-like domain